MTTLTTIFFWAAILVVLYAYGGYVICIKLFKSILGDVVSTPLSLGSYQLPNVTFIIAAYNEADWISKKIENTLLLDYPTEKLEIIVISDGSNDATPDIVKRDYSGRVKLMHQPKRMGKSAALNRAVSCASGDVLVFSDANTMVESDALILLTKHYQVANVGGVSGRKLIKSVTNAGAANEEGAYWKYESFLKRMDSDFYTVVGAAGELFSVRKSLYTVIPGDIILDDFYVSLKVCQQGYRVMYEPLAIAAEYPSKNIKEEAKRKIRIAAGGFQSILLFKALLNFFRFKKVSFLYISHRVLRWALCPFLLPIIFGLNLFLLNNNSDSILYLLMLNAQIVFYLLAFIGWLNRSNVFSFKLARIPYYFVFMNISVLGGFWLFLTGGQSSSWQRSARAEVIGT